MFLKEDIFFLFIKYEAVPRLAQQTETRAPSSTCRLPWQSIRFWCKNSFIQLKFKLKNKTIYGIRGVIWRFGCS